MTEIRDRRNRLNYLRLVRPRMLRMKEATRLAGNLSRSALYLWTQQEAEAFLSEIEQDIKYTREAFERSPNWKSTRLPRGIASVKAD